MGKNIRSSSSPKALATSFPMPPLADAMDRSPSQRGSVLSPGRGRGLGRDDGGGRHDRVRGPTSSPWEPSGLSLGPYAERDRLPRRPRESAAATGSRPCWQGGGFGELAGAARRQPVARVGAQPDGPERVDPQVPPRGPSARGATWRKRVATAPRSRPFPGALWRCRARR